jgi:hypothetical protein
LATSDAGSASQYAYVKLGANAVVARHLLATLEFTHPLGARIRQQQLPAYNYIGAVIGYHF